MLDSAVPSLPEGCTARKLHMCIVATDYTALTLSLLSRSSQYFRTSPAAMPLTILASVCLLLSPRLPTPPSSGPSRRHSSAKRFSSSLVASLPLNLPCRWVFLAGALRAASQQVAAVASKACLLNCNTVNACGCVEIDRKCLN
jgi:hypothetical protein